MNRLNVSDLITITVKSKKKYDELLDKYDAMVKEYDLLKLLKSKFYCNLKKKQRKIHFLKQISIERFVIISVCYLNLL